MQVSALHLGTIEPPMAEATHGSRSVLCVNLAWLSSPVIELNANLGVAGGVF